MRRLAGAAHRDRRRRHRRAQRSAEARRQGRRRRRSTRPRRIASADGCTPTRPAIGPNGQVSEFCGELIDSRPRDDPRSRQALRPAARQPARRASRAARPTRTPSSARTTPSTRPMPTSRHSARPSSTSPTRRAIRRRGTRRRRPAASSTTCRSTTGSSAYVPGGHHSPDRPPARRRVRRGVRRGHDRPGVAEPRSTCSASSRTEAASRSSASRTSASTSPAATSSSRRRSPTQLGDVDSSAGRCSRSGRNSQRHRLADVLDAGGRTRTVVADHVILALPFAVLRNLDYSGAGFDARKQTAITQMGAGRNTKLQLQFASRYWNTRDRGASRPAASTPTSASRTPGT